MGELEGWRWVVVGKGGEKWMVVGVHVGELRAHASLYCLPCSLDVQRLWGSRGLFFKKHFLLVCP